MSAKKKKAAAAAAAQQLLACVTITLRDCDGCGGIVIGSSPPWETLEQRMDAGAELSLAEQLLLRVVRSLPALLVKHEVPFHGEAEQVDAAAAMPPTSSRLQ